MDGKRIVQRVVSTMLIAVLMINYCDMGLLRSDVGAVEIAEGWTKKETTLSYTARWDSETERIGFHNVDADMYWSADDPSNGGFWFDTRNIPRYKIDETIVESEEPVEGSGTAGKRIVGYNSDSISEVLCSDGNVGGNTFKSLVTSATSKAANSITNVSSELYYTIEADSAFNQTVDGVEKEAYYRTYYVSTSTQLACVLYFYRAATFAKYLATNPDEISIATNKDVNTVIAADKVGIVLLSDLDLGGKPVGSSLTTYNWTGYYNTGKYLEIDGNNHTIYNGRYSGTFLSADQNFAIHNITFSHHYNANKSTGMFGNGVKYGYFKDVKWEYCVAVGQSGDGNDYAGVAIVLGKNYLDCYLKNCSISNSYVKGMSIGHSGLFASFNGNTAASGEYKGYSPVDTTNGYYYTEVPDLEIAEIAWQGKNDVDDVKMSNLYPSIFENCYTVDSSVYELGEYENTYHSGTFVSCVQGNVIFKNCFSNCSIYGKQQLGGFTGAVIGSVSGFDYPDSETGDTYKTNTVFENCFSSGIVEGQSKLGGFVGMVYDDGRATGDLKLDPPVTGSGGNRGRVMFYNCYSTSSVGMASSAEYIGGFIGVLRGNVKGTSVETKKHRFINCYAAGEVGGVANSLDTSVYNTETVGGFVGTYCPEDYSQKAAISYYTYNANYYCNNKVHADQFDLMSKNYDWVYYSKKDNRGKANKKVFDKNVDTKKNNYKVDGIFKNCFYDKQTTAMRERDVGDYPGYSAETYQYDKENGGKGTAVNYNTTGYYYKLTGTLDGITGVYTESSNKGVAGLTDTANIMVADAWVYNNGYYPQLKVFANATTTDFGGNGKTAQLCSQASTATVFLDHYDNVLDSNNGDEVASNDKTVYDTVRDITSEFCFTSDGLSESGEKTTNQVGWRINEEKNSSSSYSDYLGKDGFDVSFNSSENQAQYNYKPAVITLTPNKETNGYVFRCYEFSVGKQYVEVIACEDENYDDWAKQQSDYDDYNKKLTKLENDISNYISILGLDTSQKKYQQNDGESSEDYIKREIEEIINPKVKEQIETYIDSADNLETALDLGKKISDVCNQVEGSTVTDEELAQALKIYKMSSNNDDYFDQKEYIAARYENLSQYSVYPLKSLSVVQKPDDFNTYASKGAVGRRTFRLLPTAYIDAGSMMRVHVSDDDSNQILLMDSATGTELKRFDHTFGVVYVSTQDTPLWNGDLNEEVLNTRLINYKFSYEDETKNVTTSFYTDQNVVDRDKVDDNGEAIYYKNDNGSRKFDVDQMNNDDVFALYSRYPNSGIELKTISDIDELDKNSEEYTAYEEKAEMGLGSMVEKTSLGNFYPKDIYNKDEEGVSYDMSSKLGRTCVKVYKANVQPVYYDENGNIVQAEKFDEKKGLKNYTVERGEEVKMDEGDNKKKWAGLAKFDADDDGYYYMTYFWRLTDGRYIKADKLVQIDTSSYKVDMITGVAGAENDSYSQDEMGKFTEIDCDILKTMPTDEQISSYKFPSDEYAEDAGSAEGWLDYANETYNYGYGFDYPENTGNADTKYWAKGLEVQTSANDITVVWRRSGRYKLTKLLVMVRHSNSNAWLPMTIANFDNDGDTDIDDAQITYSYTYDSYVISQDPSTKVFNVVDSSNTVKSFKVDNMVGYQSSAVKFIKFQFVDSSSGQSLVKLTDDVKVVALFKTVEADVSVEKYVLIDDGNGAKVTEENTALYASDDYRSVDNETFEKEDKRAVLFGDKLIYRMKVHNDGIYNANNVVVTDDIPDGCTFVDGSVKMFRQKKTLGKVNSIDEYGDVEDLSKDEFKTEDYEDCYSWKETTDKDGKVTGLTWVLNPVNMGYDYYVQYEVTVDGKYSDYSREIENQAKFDYAYITGETFDGEETDTGDTSVDGYGTYNEKYAQNAVFSVTGEDSTDEEIDGKYSYTINFNQQNADGLCYIEDISNEVPKGYKLSGDVTVYRNGEIVTDKVDIDITNGNTKFTIVPYDEKYLSFGDDKADIKVTFSIEKDETYTGVIPEKRENSSTIRFYQDGSRDKLKLATLSRVDAETNTVKSSVRWLYLKLQKDVLSDEFESDYPFDSKQAFVFKLINESVSTKATYTDLYVTDTNDGIYSGDRLLQITQRGTYVISETDWADTNYDLSKAYYRYSDIEFPEDSSLESGSVSSADGVNGYVKMYLPRAMYKSTAFPLYATEDKNGERVYPTVVCTNARSDYAWLSSEQHVENSFNTAESVTAMMTAYVQEAMARTEAKTENTSDAEVATSNAVVPATGLEVKDEDEK